jgi:predicted NACHT family NTPase
LYADCVRLLLDYWQRGKVTLVAVAGQRQTEDGVLDALGLPRSRLEQALSQAAYEAHLRQARAADRKPETADISGQELRNVLAPALNNSLDNANKVIYYIQTRAGLLSERGADTYAFPHRTFQEFLAACHALDSEEFPYDLAGLVCRDREWWREVFLLA